jgi:hypothetical protein
MRPAPEYATGEVVLASTYRSVGFEADSIAEGRVPALGRDFQKAIDRGGRPQGGTGGVSLPPEAWKRVISGTLRSPKQPNQTAKRFLQISPVVPDAAIYSLSARLSANSWNPGELVSRLIQFGEPELCSAQALWGQLFNSLDVNGSDDVWARFLQQEFKAWRPPHLENAWRPPQPLNREDSISQWHRARITSPSTQFTRDLRCILELKPRLTRRQWTSLVESLLRIGTAAHILWLCRVNCRVFDLIRSTLRGEAPPDVGQISAKLEHRAGFWRIGQLAGGAINDAATDYLKARAGINLFLYVAQLRRNDLATVLSTPEDIAHLLNWTATERLYFSEQDFLARYARLLESEQRAVSGKKGIASNIKEFLGHVLRQRQTAEPGLDSYDQGYFLSKRSTARNAQWQVALGPVSVLTIVHACTVDAVAPRTVDDLCQHLLRYGIEVHPQDVPDSRLGHTLRSLGLVLDSPDAEGGMVVQNPFAHTQEAH